MDDVGVLNCCNYYFFDAGGFLEQARHRDGYSDDIADLNLMLFVDEFFVKNSKDVGVVPHY